MAKFRIRELAEERGLDAAKLARKADLSNSTVYPLWNDTVDSTTTKTLEAIARALKVSVVDLLGDELGGKLEAVLAAANY
jgi:DNA-binding Xre family transcriptional regulator